MEKLLNEPQLRLNCATETCWLSHESAIDALRRCLKAVKATLEKEAIDGDATAHGLALSKPCFIALLLMFSYVLSILGSLSRCFQVAALNLLAVEQLIKSALKALGELSTDPFQGGFMLSL